MSRQKRSPARLQPPGFWPTTFLTGADIRYSTRDYNQSNKDFHENNMCTMGRCTAEVVEAIELPFCKEHARNAFARLSAYYGAKVIAQHLLEPLPGGAKVIVKRKQKMPDLSKPGFVYVIRHGTRVKIGFTRDPKRRFAALPHDEVLALISGTEQDEANLHEKFASTRVHGEWFEAEPRILAFAAQLGERGLEAA